MNTTLPECPKCHSTYCYASGALIVCPECFYEWTVSDLPSEPDPVIDTKPDFRDANGVVLETGDTVMLVRDLKLGSETLKSGLKVKNIRVLAEPHDGHDIACKIDGVGSVYLKCLVVKKLN